jgi:EAL and modified HD-GYP domain-containing signal transduction protein
MTDTASIEHADHPLRVRDFYLGRQPVLDRNQALYGYELLFRSAAVVGAGSAGAAAMPSGLPPPPP